MVKKVGKDKTNRVQQVDQPARTTSPLTGGTVVESPGIPVASRSTMGKQRQDKKPTRQGRRLILKGAAAGVAGLIVDRVVKNLTDSPSVTDSPPIADEPPVTPKEKKKESNYGLLAYYEFGNYRKWLENPDAPFTREDYLIFEPTSDTINFFCEGALYIHTNLLRKCNVTHISTTPNVRIAPGTYETIWEFNNINGKGFPQQLRFNSEPQWVSVIDNAGREIRKWEMTKWNSFEKLPQELMDLGKKLQVVKPPEALIYDLPEKDPTKDKSNQMDKIGENLFNKEKLKHKHERLMTSSLAR